MLKFRKFHQSTRNRFGTAGKQPVGGTCAPSLNANFFALMLTFLTNMVPFLSYLSKLSLFDTLYKSTIVEKIYQKENNF